MEKLFDWSTPTISAFSQMIQNIITFLPQFVAAVVLLAVGWIIARLLRGLVLKLSGAIDKVAGLVGLGKFVSATDYREPFMRVLAGVAFWLVILFFLTSATNILGLRMFTGWLEQMVGHLPKIVSGVLIILAGVVFSNLVRDAVTTAARALPPQQRTLLGRTVQIFTLSVLVVVGVDQIGIDITVVTTIIAIFLAALLGGLSIAFSLGAKTFVSNLLGARYLSKEYRVGERIRISKIEGTIVELTPISVVLDTDQGKVTVPARLFAEESSVLLQAER